MMVLFSERNGYVEPKAALQYECMDDNLRIAIYNTLYEYLGEYEQDSSVGMVCRTIWSEHWHQALDKFPSRYWGFYEELKARIYKSEWYEPYDLLEFLAKALDEHEPPDNPWGYGRYREVETIQSNDDYSSEINITLEREQSGYRLIDYHITPITNKAEMASLEESLKVSDRYSGVRMHIESAIDHLSKKPDSDSRNAIKEAISAVEAAAKVYVGDDNADLAKAIRQMQKDGTIHPALLDGWNKIYGFTSDENGVRHGSSTEEVHTDLALAKYMLVSCSAFANFIVNKDTTQAGTAKLQVR